jgi:hypothetical protein
VLNEGATDSSCDESSLRVYQGAPSDTLRGSTPSRRWPIFISAFLIVALALVVLYTSRSAFSSPIALVVLAAIGSFAVLLQVRFRHDIGTSRTPFWLNAFGIVSALIAMFGGSLHLRLQSVELASLGAVASFGISGIILLESIRKRGEGPE